MLGAGELTSLFIEVVARALEVAAALVILAAAAVAFWRLVAGGLRHPSRAAEGTIRHDFGRSLLLALDFAIGSDILRLAVSPTLAAVLIAGLVVLARTVLTLVLEYELKQAEKGEAE